jgi:hypothetical protein
MWLIDIDSRDSDANEVEREFNCMRSAIGEKWDEVPRSERGEAYGLIVTRYFIEGGYRDAFRVAKEGQTCMSYRDVPMITTGSSIHLTFDLPQFAA